MPEIYLTGKYTDINNVVTARIGQKLTINERLPTAKQKFEVNLICYAVENPLQFSLEEIYSEIDKLHYKYPCSQVQLIFKNEFQDGKFDEQLFNSFLVCYQTIAKKNLYDFDERCERDELLFINSIEKIISELWTEIKQLCNQDLYLINTLKARTIQLYKDLKYLTKAPNELIKSYDEDCQEIIQNLKRRTIFLNLIPSLSTAIGFAAIAGFFAGFVISTRYSPKLAEGILKHFLNLGAGIVLGSSSALFTKLSFSFFPSRLEKTLSDAKAKLALNSHEEDTPGF